MLMVELEGQKQQDQILTTGSDLINLITKSVHTWRTKF